MDDATVTEKQQQQPHQDETSSYRYWVREKGEDAAPLSVPRKLNPDDICTTNQSRPPNLGSIWNQAGTWEEKSLSTWAGDRIKELLLSVGSLELPGGKAEIADVSKCVGDTIYLKLVAPQQIGLLQRYCRSNTFSQPFSAFLLIVRNKKRVGYSYELTLKVTGEWIIREEKKVVKGYIDIPEFSFGELDDLQMEIQLGEEKDFLYQDKLHISQDLKMFLQPLREKLLQFEQELKER